MADQYGDQTVPNTPGPAPVTPQADTLDGTSGDDTIHGGDLNDRILAGAGKDTISGDDGSDLLSGDADDDVLDGGAGDDLLSGGVDNDTLYGGQGDDRSVLAADIYVIEAFSGRDMIAGFDALDVVDISALLPFDDIADVKATASNVRGGVLINFGGGNTLTIGGKTVASLDSGDFVF